MLNGVICLPRFDTECNGSTDPYRGSLIDPSRGCALFVRAWSGAPPSTDRSRHHWGGATLERGVAGPPDIIGARAQARAGRTRPGTLATAEGGVVVGRVPTRAEPPRRRERLHNEGRRRMKTLSDPHQITIGSSEHRKDGHRTRGPASPHTESSALQAGLGPHSELDARQADPAAPGRLQLTRNSQRDPFRRCVGTRSRRHRVGQPVQPRAQTLLLRTLVTILVLGGILVEAETARADLGLVFRDTRATPGERVEAFSGDSFGRPSRFSSVHGIRVYFVPMADAKSPAAQRSTGPPRNPNWIPLGRLHQSTTGVVRLSFVVPNVALGDYTIGFWCLPCAPPRGATFTGAYPGTHWRGRPFGKVLRVYAPTPATHPKPTAQPSREATPTTGPVRTAWVAAVLAGTVLVGGLLVVGLRWRLRARPRTR